MAKSENIFIILGLSGLFAYEISAFTQHPDNNLFKIVRSRDTDEIFYDVSLGADGRLDPDSPVNIYWVRKSGGSGGHEPLTWIQRRYSYGIKVIESSPGHALFRFVSFDSKVFRIERGADGRFIARTNIGDNQVTVERIYVRFDGGTYLAPVVGEVIMYGRDTKTGDLLSEDIKH